MTHLVEAEYGSTVAGNGDGLCLSPALPTSPNGWPLRPLQIVSLRDMIRCYPNAFYVDGYFIHDLEHSVQMNLQKPGAATTATEEEIAVLRKIMDGGLAGYAEELGLQRIAERLEKLKHFFDDNDLCLRSYLLHELRELDLAIATDLNHNYFLYMPEEDAAYYEQEQLFGVEIQDAFPEANREITFAGSCYSTGNYTACVFHLMRAVELVSRLMFRGMKAVKHLPRPIQLCTWGELIAALEEGLKGLQHGKRTSAARSETFEYYNHAVGSFRNFKAAWRDPNSHTGKLYQPRGAKDIMENTRQYMQHLATRLKE